VDVLFSILTSLASLAAILFCCELFTNAIEWLGRHLKLGAGAVGSVLAAVGTALPETLVPIVAIVFIGGDAAHDIGVGAILGAPFMLATLAFAIMGITVFGSARRGKRSYKMAVDEEVLRQDLACFFVVYTVAALSALLPWYGAKVIVAVALVCCYGVYVWLHFRKPSHAGEEDLKALYFGLRRQHPPRLRTIVAQVVVALAGIMLAAGLFVKGLERISEHFGASALVLSLIITPIATELPEKFNSVIWIRRGKDTLALGNVTGAMVFQGCIPVAVGLLGTPWLLDATSVASVVIALVSAMLVFAYLILKRNLDSRLLLVGLPLYIAFLLYAFAVRG
jgi:cation:H+ antiporter